MKAIKIITAVLTGLCCSNLSEAKKIEEPMQEHIVSFGSFQKAYPIKRIPNTTMGIVYVSGFADDFDLIEPSAEDLAEKIKASGIIDTLDAVVIPGDKGNAMAALLVRILREFKQDIKLFIFRSTPKGGDFKKVNYKPITSDTPKTLYISENHFNALKGKNIIIFDDVISTGATVRATKQLTDQAGAKVIAYACSATEGDDMQQFDNLPLFKSFHLPIYPLK